MILTSGCYSLIPSSIASTSGGPVSSANERLWLVVRTLKDRGVAVLQGDVIKLGRYRVKVKEVIVSPQDVEAMGSVRLGSLNRTFFVVQRRFLCHDDDDGDCETVAPDPVDVSVVMGDVSNHAAAAEDTNMSASAAAVSDSSPGRCSPSPNPSTPSSTVGVPPAPEEPPTERPCLFPTKSMGSRICRICLCEAEDDDIDNEVNPLIAPCECKGSMKWVHLMCLRTWMAGRLNIRNVGQISILYIVTI